LQPPAITGSFHQLRDPRPAELEPVTPLSTASRTSVNVPLRFKVKKPEPHPKP
jgi:hypothetical protein